MKQKLETVTCLGECCPKCPHYQLPQTTPKTVKEIESKKSNILPWIADGSYLSEEFQKKIEATIKEIYGDAKPGTILWDMHHRTVI